jgi:hypothetical protein
MKETYLFTFDVWFPNIPDQEPDPSDKLLLGAKEPAESGFLHGSVLW